MAAHPLLAAVCSGMVLTLLAGCGHRAAATGDVPPVVKTAKVAEEEVTDYEYFTGRTDAVDSVEVRARVAGYLTEINFKPGDEVKKGELLFRIDPRPYKAELDRSQAQVELAKARLSLSIADVARANQLAKSPGAISQADIDKFLATQAESTAAVEVSKAVVETARLNLEYTEISSPVDGLVGRNLISIGNLVSPNTTLLTTIVSQDPMYAYFDVNERTMLRVQDLIRQGRLKGVREGGIMNVQFGLANEGDTYPHEGVVDFVNNRVDTSTGTLQVRGKIDNPKPENPGPRLLTTGLFVRVRVPIGPPHPALLTPQRAIGMDLGQKFVLVVNKKNVVEQRPVGVGAVQANGLQVIFPVQVVRGDEGLRPINEGETGELSIKAGEEVIVSGLQRVRPGMEVRAEDLASSQKSS